jgi:tetratricopeptide (TPR) repeat protein
MIKMKKRSIIILSKKRATLQLSAILILWLFMFGVIKASGYADSLRKELNSTIDSNWVKTSIELSKFYDEQQPNPDSALWLAQNALEISTRIGYSRGIILSNRRIGNTYFQRSDFENAFAYTEIAILEAKRVKSIVDQGLLYQAISVYYYNVQKVEEAFYYNMKAMRILEKTNEFGPLAYTYYMISGNLANKDQDKERLHYMRKALSTIQKIPEKETTKNLKAILGILIGGGACYSDLYALNPVYLDSAMYYCEMGISICKKYEVVQRENSFRVIIAQSYSNQNEWKTSVKMCQSILTSPKPLKPIDRHSVFNILTKCNFELGNYAEALQFLDSTRHSLNSNDPKWIQFSAEYEYKIQKALGNNVAAIKALELSQAMKDTMALRDKIDLLNDLKEKYQAELKDAEISKLSQQQQIDALQKRWLISIVGLVILILVVLAILYRQNVIRARLRQGEIEQRLNRSRMNPHFFFNVLSSLQMLALDEKRRGEASLYLSKYARIMRQSLESTYTDMIPLEDEISFLREYLDLQKLRFPAKFDYQITVAPEIDAWEIRIPSMLLQPFVENSIEHGFKNVSAGGLLQIFIRQSAHGIEVVIEDNGNTTGEENKHKGYPSRATQIVRDRLSLLNQRYKSQAGYEISRSAAGQGYRVEIHLPLVTS